MTVGSDVELCDVSQCGALILAPGPLTLNSRCTLRIQSDGAVELESRVRRVVARGADGGYHIGLEFILSDEGRIEHAMRVLGKDWGDSVATSQPCPPQGATDAAIRQSPYDSSRGAVDRDDDPVG